jgi:phospholipase D1/2
MGHADDSVDLARPVSFFPGQNTVEYEYADFHRDFNNSRIMDFHNVKDWQQNQLSKAEYGRMPWHDTSLCVIGDSVMDICQHFVLRVFSPASVREMILIVTQWNFIKRDKYKRDKRFPWLLMPGFEGKDEDLIGVQRPPHPVGGMLCCRILRLLLLY